MRDLGHIVVFAPAGLDSSGAIDRAQRLLAPGGTITVVDVLPELPALARAVLPPALDTMHVRERERELVDSLRSTSTAASVRVQVMAGNPAARLSRFVTDERVDLVLRVSAGVAVDARLDPLDMKLLRKCPCAVWVVAPGPIRSLRTVLAAVDAFTPAADAQLQESIIRHARAVASRDGAKVHIVHVWHVPGEHLLRRHLAVTELQNHIQETRRSAQHAVRQLLRQAEEGDVTLHLVRGEPPAAIVRAADRIPADLVVIGTVARTGVPGALIGNTAELVLGMVHCEVLVLKPAGFVSPLVVTPAATVVANTA